MLLRRAFLLAPVFPVLQSQDTKPKMFGDAEVYERFMGRWSRLVAPRLVDFTDLPERGRMLDVGSGTGSLTFAIAKQMGQARIVGDRSVPRIRRLRDQQESLRRSSQL